MPRRRKSPRMRSPSFAWPSKPESTPSSMPRILQHDAGMALALKRGHVAMAMDVYSFHYIDTEGCPANWPEEFLRKNVETTEIQRQAFTVPGWGSHCLRHHAGASPHGLNARQGPFTVARGMTPMQVPRPLWWRRATWAGKKTLAASRPASSAISSPYTADRLVDIKLLQQVEKWSSRVGWYSSSPPHPENGKWGHSYFPVLENNNVPIFHVPIFQSK